MADLAVRMVQRSEIKQVTNWLLEARGQDPQFQRIAGGGLRRVLFRQFIVPRYLRGMATTWILEVGDAVAGYAILEQRGIAVNLADMAVFEDFDRASIVPALLERVEQFAREREYGYVRTALAAPDEQMIEAYQQAGYQYLDYYLWAYTGEVSHVEPPAEVTLTQIAPGKALERRLDYLRQELDASEPIGRELIDASFLPSRPPRQRVFEIFLTADDGEPGPGIGYLSGRPNERGDGILTIILSTAPAYWGTDLEAQIAGGVAVESGAGTTGGFRLLLSTTRHCEQSDPALAAIGMERHMDRFPVLFKRVEL